eukprot:4563453-Alexandrium_andersonii.AAC.1
MSLSSTLNILFLVSPVPTTASAAVLTSNPTAWALTPRCRCVDCCARATVEECKGGHLVLDLNRPQ